MADFLEGKPLGFCPWCDHVLYWDGKQDSTTVCLHCFDYHDDDTEDENRIRYAAQRLEESKLWNKIDKQGGER